MHHWRFDRFKIRWPDSGRYLPQVATVVDEAKNNEQINTFTSNATSVSYYALISCTLPEEISSVDHDDMTPEEDYCVRKRIIDNKLLTFEGVTLDPNPDNIDTANVDCSVLYPNLIDKFEEKSKKKLLTGEPQNDNAIICYFGSIRNGTYLDQSLEYSYIKEFKMSDDKKKELRDKLIKLGEGLLKNAEACFLTTPMAIQSTTSDE